MHISIPKDLKCEFINVQQKNPLISKCQIKVLYVDDNNPNRNKTLISKEVAKEMANSLPGCPIVGFYNENIEDFEEHNRTINISNGKIQIKDITFPYGFVDLNSKVWFQWFTDDDGIDREYLLTEGYIWTGQFPEAKRIIDKGNNQSMELDEKNLKGFWAKDNEKDIQFFIINEAIISKLCILGENVEPCFEGAQITKVNFALEDKILQKQLYSMAKQLKEFLEEGGKELMNIYSVQIGDLLWNSVYSFLENNNLQDKYMISGFYTDEEQKKFAILKDRKENQYKKLYFEEIDTEFNFNLAEDYFEPDESYSDQFDFSLIEKYELEKNGQKKSEDQEENSVNNEKEENLKEEEEDIKTKYALLSENFNLLNSKYEAINEELEQIKQERDTLLEFKKQIEKKDKLEMINSFYMLNDEDKSDVIANIDSYSLDDIEAKLSIICVRNKVNFNLNNEQQDLVYHLNDGEQRMGQEEEEVPAWIQAIRKNSLN